MFENFCSNMKCFALESFNLSCQTGHTCTKIQQPIKC